MKPLVSILIPAYNAEAWISDTLRSAIAQTWERKEIIVVDDGSKDQTLAVARQFESDQLRVVTQKNQGAAATRNNAFSMCKGDYIQCLDADDLMAPDKIAKQMEALGQSREQTDAPVRQLGTLHVPLLSDEIHAKCVVVRSVSRRMVDTQDAIQSLYADGFVARQSRISRGGGTLGYQVVGR